MSIIARITGLFKKNSQTLEKEMKLNPHFYLGKFVKHDFTDIGESIAIDGTRIIIKNAESILSIPHDVILKNTDNILVGDFDSEESLKLGKEWAERKDILKFDNKGMMIR